MRHGCCSISSRGDEKEESCKTFHEEAPLRSKHYYHQGKSKKELKSYKEPKKKEKKEPINLLKKLSSSPSSKSGTH